MHLRQAEYHIGLGIITELYQFFYNGCIIKVGKPFSGEFSFCFYAGIFVEIIVAAEVIFIQQKVHLFTPFTAKIFVICRNNFFALLSAMVTGGFYNGCRNDRKNICAKMIIISGGVCDPYQEEK